MDRLPPEAWNQAPEYQPQYSKESVVPGTQFEGIGQHHSEGWHHYTPRAHDHRHLQPQSWPQENFLESGQQGGYAPLPAQNIGLSSPYGDHTRSPLRLPSSSQGTRTLNHGNRNNTYNNSVHNRHEKDQRSQNGFVINVNMQTERVPEVEPFLSLVPTISGGSSAIGTVPIPTSLPSPSCSASVPVSDPASPDNLTPAKAKGEQMTESQRYESLLLRYPSRLGYPLWDPSPRCTPDGEYLLDIGDVGAFSDGLPFHTFFNITQPSDSPANKNGIPTGVDPPCTIQPEWLLVKPKFHEEKRTFAQRKGAVRQTAENDVFTFDLRHREGALLMLPRGGDLKCLERTEEFKTRIKDHWPQWYAFAHGKKDLDDQEALYVVTGVTRCSTWAIAVWDSDCDNPGSLKLSVDEPSGRCSWSYPPADCTPRTSLTPPSSEVDALKQCVFVRGFWINRSDGKVVYQAPSVRYGSYGDKKGSDDKSDTDHSKDHSGSQSPGDAPGSSTSNSSSGRHPPASSGGPSEPPGSLSCSSSDSPVRLRVEELDLYISASDLYRHEHPCQVINQFALALMSKTHPELLDVGCIAFSHDDDWMSIVEDHPEEKFPGKIEMIRRISSKFKFVVEQGSIYPTRMSKPEKAVRLHSLSAANIERPEGVIAALVEFLGPEVTHVPSQTGALESLVTKFEHITATEASITSDTTVDTSRSTLKLPASPSHELSHSVYVDGRESRTRRTSSTRPKAKANDDGRSSSKIGSAKIHEDHDHDHSRSHSHSIFGGHSHSHGEDDHHGTEQIMAAFQGSGDRGSQITLLGLYSNVGLTIAKGLAGWFLHSASLLADAGHSLSDLLGDFVTLFCWRLSRKSPTEQYPYGFAEFETLGTTVVSLLLMSGALEIGFHSYHLLISALIETAASLPTGPIQDILVNVTQVAPRIPEALQRDHHSHISVDPNAAWFALISVIAKEWLYRATKRVADEEHSPVLLANAIHHRSDAYSSLVALIAILGSSMFPHVPLDPIGGLVVSFVILQQGTSLLLGAWGDLTDAGVSPKTRRKLLQTLDPLRHETAISISDLRARRAGSLLYVGLTAASGLTVEELSTLEERILGAMKEKRREVAEVRVKFKPRPSQVEI